MQENLDKYIDSFLHSPEKHQIIVQNCKSVVSLRELKFRHPLAFSKHCAVFGLTYLLMSLLCQIFLSHMTLKKNSP